VDEWVKDMVAQRQQKRWVLFVDRDGVVNRQLKGSYVRSWAEFQWVPGSLEALVALATWAPHIVLVSNQQGVGKGLMSAAHLDDIHARMLDAISTAGGRLDAIRTCPHLESDICACRKPKPGLAVDWLDQNPLVESALSIMIGDSDSDMQMAKNLASITGGCEAVRIGPRGFLPWTFTSLAEFAAAVIF
jgi:D-glycero-D-manno-heptose 1,7-bisphosphate phosphatase